MTAKKSDLAKNAFKASIQKSFTRAIKLSSFSDAALEANRTISPAIDGLYNFYHPKHLLLINANDNRVAQTNVKVGSTTAKKNLLKGLTQKVNDWDFEIQKTYRDFTDEYKIIFANGHNPFTQGKQTDRLGAVHSLSIVLGNYPLLNLVKTDVDAYYDLLLLAYNTQQGNISTGGQDSGTVTNICTTIANALQYVYGGLIMQYSDNLDPITNFFDMETLQQKPQKTFTKHLNGGQVFTICKHSFKTTDDAYFSNISDATLRVYIAHEKGETNPTVFFDVPPRVSNIVVHAPQLGNVADGRYLIVKNLDPNLPGDIEVNL
ncbi:MAG: hypothetical protein NTX03_12055 [Bacteroidetes bacterium]|nr:hypothetical protein [Bacteroidota bacterium]